MYWLRLWMCRPALIWSDLSRAAPNWAEISRANEKGAPSTEHRAQSAEHCAASTENGARSIELTRHWAYVETPHLLALTSMLLLECLRNTSCFLSITSLSGSVCQSNILLTNHNGRTTLVIWNLSCTSPGLPGSISPFIRALIACHNALLDWYLVSNLQVVAKWSQRHWFLDSGSTIWTP